MWDKIKAWLRSESVVYKKTNKCAIKYTAFIEGHKYEQTYYYEPVYETLNNQLTLIITGFDLGQSVQKRKGDMIAFNTKDGYVEVHISRIEHVQVSYIPITQKFLKRTFCGFNQFDRID